MSEKKIKDLTYIRLLNSKQEQGTLSIGDSIGDDSVGGEGQVLKLLSLSNYNCDEFVIKVFHDLERNADKENKIKDMLSLSEKYDIPNTVCWPFAIVYDKDKFVGYLMKKAQGVSLSKFMHGKKTQSEFNNYKDCHYAQICLSIMNTVQKLHQYDILVGDINEDNFIVNNPNMVYFIDTDSYQFGKYKCNVGRENYFSPEYYETQMLDENSEGYSIIILIFKILMLGRDPFTSRLNEELSKKEKVIKGLFPYNINDDITKKLISPPFYFELWNKLSLDLKYYFINIFTRYEVYNGTFDIISILEQYLDDCSEIVECLEEKSSDNYTDIGNASINIENTNVESKDEIDNDLSKNSDDTMLGMEFSEISNIGSSENSELKTTNEVNKNDNSHNNIDDTINLSSSLYKLALKCQKIINDILEKHKTNINNTVPKKVMNRIRNELEISLPNGLKVINERGNKVTIQCADFGIQTSSSSNTKGREHNYNKALKRIVVEINNKTKEIINDKEKRNNNEEEILNLSTNALKNEENEIFDSSMYVNKTSSSNTSKNLKNSENLLKKCQSIILRILDNRDIDSIDKDSCEIIKYELNNILDKGVTSFFKDKSIYIAMCPDLKIEAYSSGTNNELNYINTLKKLYNSILDMGITNDIPKSSNVMDKNVTISDEIKKEDENKTIMSVSDNDTIKELELVYKELMNLSSIGKLKTRGQIMFGFQKCVQKYPRLNTLIPKPKLVGKTYVMIVRQIQKTFSSNKMSKCYVQYFDFIKSNIKGLYDK